MYSPADTGRFKPVSHEEKAAIRQDLLPGWIPQDAFVLGWIGRNQWRKQNWLLYAVLHYLRSGKYFICQRCERITLMDWHPSLQRHRDELDDVAFTGVGQASCRYCRSTDLAQAKPLTDIVLWFHSIDREGHGA